jgi:Galactose oxidase, central domain
VTRAGMLIAAAALFGCTPRVVEYTVGVVTTSCDAAADPFAGAKYLNVRVTGDGLETPLEANSDVSARTIALPEIPAGPGRVIQIRVYGEAGPGSKVLSWGQSLPFDVPDLVPDEKPPTVPIFLRKVDAFTPLASVTNPKECAKMKIPRAGHSATLLNSGKVFITGGYRHKEGTTERIALADAELFNPNTGAFESTLSISVGSQVLPSAFHTATRMLNGTVLLWGGEQYLGGPTNVPAPRATALVFDPEKTIYRAVKSRSSPKNLVRSRHGAALDKNGLVLIAGGLGRDGNDQLVPVAEIEWFDPVQGETYVVDPLGTPRLEPSVAAVQGGALIAVAGGSDGGTLLRDVTYYGYDGNVFKPSGSSPQLGAARRGAAVATARNGDDLLLFGGYGDPNTVAPLSSTEVVGTRNNTVGDGPNVGARGDACAATLKDGTLLVIGGRTVDALGRPPHSDANVTVIKPSPSGGFATSIGPSLATPRYAHTCTTLSDGSVLVLGGVNETNGTPEVLQDAFIFQPAPLD